MSSSGMQQFKAGVLPVLLCSAVTRAAYALLT